MRKLLIAITAAAVTLGVLATATLARQNEIHSLPEDVVPTCPGEPCLAITQTTGMQVKVGDERKPVVSPRDGRLVSFKLRLGDPDKDQIAYYNKNFGRGARVRISVLKPRDKLRYRVSGQSEDYVVTSYFGRTVEFALKRSLTVRKGYVIALTVPTWAPVLAVGSGDEAQQKEYAKAHAWRASRGEGRCNPPYRQTAQTRRGQLAQYRCLYRARLTYSALVISTP